ncbi:MAG: PEP-utilizing enzyme, partial [Anaerolineae bacterium]
MLDLARTSYRLRDDDNIYLGGIDAGLLVAVEEGRERLQERRMVRVESFGIADVARALRYPEYVPQTQGEKEKKAGFLVRARQLIGQPAGPRVAQGPARVITSQADLTGFEYGEILACDAVDPNMTFVVPLSAGVVERRGGTLIHGAIIAREYGLPCVTGVPRATSLIRTGDVVTVDEYLGIVMLRERGETSSIDSENLGIEWGLEVGSNVTSVGRGLATGTGHGNRVL